MKKRDAVAQGWLDAYWFLKDYAVKSRDDIQPEKWAHAFEIEIVEDDLDGAGAQLIRLPDHVQIVLPTRIPEYCARRFAIVHELYHFLKKHPSLTPTMICSSKALRGRKLHRFEIGSNAFAGAVLLPDFLVRKRCEVSPVSLEVPRQLEKEFDVSILTAAIRFCELSSERCCAVFSRNGVIEWVAPSPTWTRTIAEGQRLHRDTLAWDPFGRGKLDDRAQPIPACAWFDAPDGVDIVEHATWRPDYGTVLSMLWAPEAVARDLGMA
ncbi:MAG TPA: ImmA/IrrE family metallo-endopeptidase [Kofleriaceae bacterium]|nr:ImmA/IrrE family metallo-endopeptidase [Kofleriaceae bacterium]